MTTRKRTVNVDEKCQYVTTLKEKGTEKENDAIILREARKSKISFKNQINELEDTLDSLYDKVDIETAKLPLNANKILDAEDEIALTERRLKNAKALYEKLFGEKISE